MEEKIKLYSKKAIATATILGGPLVAGFLIRKNSLNLGRKGEGLIVLIIAIISTILLFWGILSIPESTIDKIPSLLIPFLNGGIAYLVVELMHGKILKKHKEENNEFYRTGREVVVALICCAIYFGIYFTVDYFIPDWDVETYNSEIAKFTDNERDAMPLYEMLDGYESKYEIIQFIEQTGIPKWKENIDISNKISGIENLPKKLLKDNEEYLEYSKLRLQAYELILQAVQNESAEYSEEINKLHARLDEYLK